MQLDRVRGSYGMKESMLATVLVKACGISDKSEAAKSVRDWKQRGVEHAGDFPAVLEHVRMRRCVFMNVACSTCLFPTVDVRVEH